MHEDGKQKRKNSKDGNAPKEVRPKGTITHYFNVLHDLEALASHHNDPKSRISPCKSEHNGNDYYLDLELKNPRSEKVWNTVYLNSNFCIVLAFPILVPLVQNIVNSLEHYMPLLGSPKVPKEPNLVFATLLLCPGWGPAVFIPNETQAELIAKITEVIHHVFKHCLSR
ncbi:unnamed protein product [Vicia faba]|uniref:Uncharacterized protein n=1 Tax=Vicia faba TaxID=3906 RepID=A0AAV0Z124_VICFA|nr:unnamed protein product [Vicia faba]